MPVEAAPVLSTMDPLTPAVPAVAVWMRTLPLDVREPEPDVIVTLPPEVDDVSPADNIKLPPIPLLPLPTVI